MEMMDRRIRGMRSDWAGVLLVVSAAGWVAACGGDERPKVIDSGGFAEGARPTVGPPPGNGGANSAGGRGNMAGAGGSEVSDPAAPLVSVLSPEAVGEPGEGGVLIEPEIEVVCEVKRSTVGGAEPVDKSSITIDLLDAEGKPVDSKAAAPTNVVDQFSAHFFLTEIEENGRVGFRCNARDTAQSPKLGFHAIESFVDHGPRITVTAPEPDSAHALFGPVRFEFSVEPDPVADGDEEAEVGQVLLDVNGVDIDPGAAKDGTYTVFVDFADQNLFADIPNGVVPVSVRAQNQRTPAPAERVHNYGFVIDGEGPVIAIQSPSNEQVVGGRVQLKFSVSDQLSGVNPDSVVIELNGRENHYGEGGTWSREGNNYVFLFDSTQAEEDSKIQATITIRASDEVGNSSDGESLIVYLDNVPPLVDLDPSHVRELREVNGKPFCSLAFDPVGDLSANDEALVYDVQRIRALVADRTNEAPGQNILYYSSQDKDSVYVYLQPDVEEPLLIDTDGDGTCDELIETRNDLPFQHLSPLYPGGSAWYGPAGSDVESERFPKPPICEYEGVTPAPDALCANESDMWRVVSWPVTATIPMIYSVGNNAAGDSCTGTDWEIGQFVEEGWFCVAARAEDHAGNVGISRPLRLCFDNGIGDAPDCSSPPECTDGCRAPDRVEPILLEP
jgi:hypothetical protein